MAKKPTDNALDHWTFAKVIQGIHGLFMAAAYARYEEQKESERSLPGWGNDEDQHLRRFVPTLEHLVRVDNRAPFSQIQIQYGHLLEEMSDIENTYLVLKRFMDFSIDLFTRVDKVLRRHIQGKVQASFLSDSEFAELSGIVADADHFSEYEILPSDIFHRFIAIEQSIRRQVRLDEKDAIWLRNVKHLRQRGRPREFSFKFLILVLSVFFERQNDYGHKGTIPYDYKAEGGNGIFYVSAYFNFLQAFILAIDLDFHFETDHETVSFARKVLARGNKVTDSHGGKFPWSSSSQEELVEALMRI